MYIVYFTIYSNTCVFLGYKNVFTIHIRLCTIVCRSHVASITQPNISVNAMVDIFIATA